MKRLSDEEIYENLCYYDQRNPNGINDPELVGVKEGCNCANCFYGRTKLATALLEARSGMFTEDDMKQAYRYGQTSHTQTAEQWFNQYGKKEREHGEA